MASRGPFAQTPSSSHFLCSLCSLWLKIITPHGERGMAGREALTGEIQRGSTTKNTKSTKGPGPLRRRYKSHPFPNRPLKVNQLPLPKGWREAFRRNAFCQPSFVFFVFFVVKNYHTARGAWHSWPGSPDRGNPKRVNHKEHKGHKRTGATEAPPQKVILFQIDQ